MWEAAGEPQGLRFKTRWVPHFSRSLREVGFVTFFRSKPSPGLYERPRYFTVSPTLALCVNDPPVAVTVKWEPPLTAPDPLISVRVEDPLPGAATLAELKVAVTPLGSPEAESATAALKPPSAAVVSFNVAFAVELTVALAALGVNKKPGTFTASVCF